MAKKIQIILTDPIHNQLMAKVAEEGMDTDAEYVTNLVMEGLLPRERLVNVAADTVAAETGFVLPLSSQQTFDMMSAEMKADIFLMVFNELDAEGKLNAITTLTASLDDEGKAHIFLTLTQSMSDQERVAATKILTNYKAVSKKMAERRTGI